IHNLPSRLELAAEVIDDLANGVWVATDCHRERLFSLEAQLWRIARTTDKAAAHDEDLLAFAERSLRAVRSNIGLCLKLPVCDEDEGIELLEGVGRELDAAIAELGALRQEPEPRLRLAAGGRP